LKTPGRALNADEIRHKPAGTREEVVTRGWLPADVKTIGTHRRRLNSEHQIGETIERILSFRGTMDWSI